MASIPDAELVDRLPGILVDGDNKDFYRGWLERRLVLNRCEDCGRWHHPPKPICPECWSDRIRPTPVSGRGTVHLLVWLRQGPPAHGVDYSTPTPSSPSSSRSSPASGSPARWWTRRWASSRSATGWS